MTDEQKGSPTLTAYVRVPKETEAEYECEFCPQHNADRVWRVVDFPTWVPVYVCERHSMGLPEVPSDG